MPDNPETMKRINRANAHAGGVAFWCEDAIWDDIDALTDAFDNSEFRHQLPHDDDPVARRIAGHMVKNTFAAWDAMGKRRVSDIFCPESEATLYVLGAGYPGYDVALRNIEQLREVQHDMRANWRCDTNVNAKCGRRTTSDPNADYPVEFLAIKRGDRICVFTACHPCLLHISSGAGVDHPDYIGPSEDWYDDGPEHMSQPDTDDPWGP
jgi:hypothetical protein